MSQVEPFRESPSLLDKLPKWVGLWIVRDLRMAEAVLPSSLIGLASSGQPVPACTCPGGEPTVW